MLISFSTTERLRIYISSLSIKDHTIFAVKMSVNIKTLFILCHIFLALDFGYINRPKTVIKVAIQCLTVLNCILFSFCSLYYFYVSIGEANVLMIYLGFITLHYFLNSIVITLYGYDKSLNKLQKFLMSIDLKLCVKSDSYGIEKKMNIICATCFLYKLVLNYTFCMKYNNECVNSFWAILIYIMQNLSFDIVMFVYSFMFYSVYCRLKVLNDLVQNSGKYVNEYLIIYKGIVNALEKAKGHFDLVYTFALIFKMPDLVLTLYISLLKIKINYEYDEAHNHFLRNFYIIHAYMVLMTPAVTAGLVSAAVSELQLIIHERLLLEREEEYIPDLGLFLWYVEARPLQFTVFKIVPLDWSLPVLVLDVCISYQIIVVQITKLY